MERLLPVMFHRYLNDDVWMTLAELSHFYRQFCAKEIKKEMIEKLEKEIPVLLCKLEKSSLQDGSIQCNIYWYIFHMKLR
jgi:hypothetical protein